MCKKIREILPNIIKNCVAICHYEMTHQWKVATMLYDPRFDVSTSCKPAKYWGSERLRLGASALSLHVGRALKSFRVNCRSWQQLTSDKRQRRSPLPRGFRVLRYKTKRRIRRAHAAITRLMTRRVRKEQVIKDFAPRPDQAQLLALEPRIVFDAAAVATADDTADQVSEQQTDAALDYEGGKGATDTSEEQLDVSAIEPSGTTTEIAFVDGAVENLDQLLTEIGPDVEVVLLDADSDGVKQIASVLKDRTDVDAIHILAHGDEGKLYLGNTVLDATSIQGEHLDELTAIGSSLTAEGDILIYGCDFTGGDAGLEAAILLGGITGADIAASTDTTGHADLGGDWDLETEVGSIETEAIEAIGWEATLAPIDLFDDGGNDDINQEQSDLTAFEIDYTNVSSGLLDIKFQIDPVANSGGNSSDLSLLFDTDGDGNANYSFVITLENDPFTVTAVFAQSGANDSSPIKIVGNTNNISLGTTSWFVDIGTNPFTGDPDTRVNLTLDINAIAADAGVAVADVKFLNYVTLPSPSPTSNPFDIGISDTELPYATDDSATTLQDQAVLIDILPNDSSRLSPSTVQIATAPSNGSVSVQSDGQVLYTPDPGFSGTDTFVYEAVAVDGAYYSATVTVTVISVDARPFATADEFVTGVDAAISGNILSNDELGDTPITSASVDSGPSSGTLTSFDTTTGDFTYTPNAGFNGVDTFSYTITDADGDTSTATVTITVGAPGWKITGTTSVTEGGIASYVIEFTDQIAGGTSVSVDLTSTHLATTDGDFTGTLSQDVIDAVNAAIAGRSELSFDGTTLTYTAPVPYVMTYDPAGSGFVDISGTGTALSLLDNDASLQSLGFNFDFFDATYTEIYVGSNGVITFGAAATDPNNVDLSSGPVLGGTPAILGFWDDLDPPNGGTVYFQTDGAGNAIIQWENLSHASTPANNGLTFQVVLNGATGEFSVYYDDTDYAGTGLDDGLSATIGIQDGSGTILQHSFNSAAVINGSSLDFSPNVTGPFAPIGFSVATFDDANIETAENYQLSLSNPTNSVVTAADTVTTTILDDDNTAPIANADRNIGPEATPLTGNVLSNDLRF